MELTRKQFDSCFPHASKANLEKFWPFVTDNLIKYEINSGPQPARRIAAFFAQLAHESGSLHYTDEIASGDAYEGRKDLGNISPGDGKKYKGRGLIQITGRSNYQEMGEIMKLDLINDPELLEQPKYAFQSACIFWNSRGLNRIADIDGFERITKKINGGLNGYTDRLARWDETRKALGVVK
jgi:putative chitinase